MLSWDLHQCPLLHKICEEAVDSVRVLYLETQQKKRAETGSAVAEVSPYHAGFLGFFTVVGVSSVWTRRV